MFNIFFQIPQCKITFQNDNACSKNYLLVAGGREPDMIYLKSLAENKTVICADKGISYCKKAKIIPKALLGDGDSCENNWSWAQENQVYTKQYSCDKDYTDLQLALDYIFDFDDCKTLIITGIWGGRFDHLYSAVSILAKYVLNYNCNIMLADEQEVMVLLNNSDLQVDFNILPNVISVLPFSEQIKLSLTGCKWDLFQTIVKKDNLYSISNCLKADNKLVNISVHDGMAGFYSCYSIR